MAAQHSYIRKVSEDAKLRPFLSAHFDVEAYLRSVVEKNRSEECFKDITVCIDEVNEEIKRYITQHKDDLMSGMQDVAVLAERYRTLSGSSSKLQKSVDRLKKAAIESHDLVRMKSTELERIHLSSTLIRQLRQFAHAKSQLDHLLQAEGDAPLDAGGGDIRQLASAAKVLSELEGLLGASRLAKEQAGDNTSSTQLCSLHDVSFVAKQVQGIQRFGQQLRRTAQEKLIITLKERNQAAVATSLQVFYNLNCLPEIVLLAIDTTIRSFVEVTINAIDLESFALVHSDLTNSVSGQPTTSQTGSASLLASAAPKPVKKGNFSQMRVAMREISYNWTSHIHEHAMRINVLQRVVAKKEDPTSHKKFSDVLRVSSTNPSLQAGRLLDVFWERLSISLQDIAGEKIKSQPTAAARIYPCLRKAAIETLHSLEFLSMRDKNRDTLSSASSLTSAGADFGSNGVGIGAGGMPSEGSGVFGSLLWTPSELVSGAIGVTSKGLGLRKSRGRTSDMRQLGSGHVSIGHEKGEDPIESHGLISGLRPMRDRYLVAALQRMTMPVHQMFPEMAGYEGAVPSKRDLQALLKALQMELVSAAVEGDLSLLKSTCKEMQKSIHLVVTKVEGMTMTGLDSKKMNSQNSFAKTHQQEHNCQLVILLYQLKESLEKLPTLAVKEAMDTPGSSLAAAVTAAAAAAVETLQSGLRSPHESLYEDLTESVEVAVALIDELATRQLLYPLVDSMTTYVRGVLIGLLKEGVTSTTASQTIADDDVECSRAAQMIVQQAPEMLKSHLLSLPKSPAVLAAIEEFCLRVMATYVSIASLLRPVNEMSRLRTAKDMASIEGMVLPYCSSNAECPVTKEFKAFRHLLFAEDAPANASSKSATTLIPPAPSRARLLSLPFVASLRPSTLLGHLISCGPAQLPSPHDTLNKIPTSYFETLTHPSSYTSKATDMSVRNLYCASGDWRQLAPEIYCWEAVQECLDLFLQRAVVAEPAYKAAMRAWYEALMDIGGHYFGNLASTRIQGE